MIEIWKPIDGYHGKYEISNHGNVKSLSRVIGHGKGYLIQESILNNQKDSDDYLQVCLPVENRRKKSFKIHQLVAKHFKPDFISGCQVCHTDGNKLNNNEDNLYVGNTITNTLDKYKQGRTKLTLEQIGEIINSTCLQGELSKKYGVAQSFISRIKNGTRGKGYRFSIQNTQLTIV